MNWAIQQGYLLKGTREILWGRYEQGSIYLRQVEGQNVQVDERLVGRLAYEVNNIVHEFGEESAGQALQLLTTTLKKSGYSSFARRLTAQVSANAAFIDFKGKHYQKVQGEFLRAIINRPEYLFNRGMLAILVRSFWRS
jgi:hypothetical protein